MVATPHMSDLYAECHKVGGMTAHYRLHDPQRLAFVAARYLFVAKMLAGVHDVLEIGCADGYFSPIVRQHVGKLTAIDTDAQSIGQAQAANSPRWPIHFECADFMRWERHHIAAYCLDVLEHVEPEKEHEFLERLWRRSTGGMVVIGTPSLASQAYASELSRAGHVNCKGGAALMESFGRVWKKVFPFSMTDTAFYPGFSPMARYYLAVCTS